ncbi:MAG: hypothetical protein MK289_06415 [Trichodesmium sp. ALOHA_ZT_67]|nr:hypothetical protein [Trichodesmium sp. ALOHA_ZT_67]
MTLWQELLRKNQEDARAYIEHYMKMSEVGANIQSWLFQNNMSETQLCQGLVTEDGNNFMYLSRV